MTLGVKTPFENNNLYNFKTREKIPNENIIMNNASIVAEWKQVSLSMHPGNTIQKQMWQLVPV
jgi:hypothetical protein